MDPIVPALMRVEVPQTLAGASYSLTWAVAAAAIDLAGGPTQFSEEALRREDIHPLRSNVTIVADLRNPEDTRFACRARVSDGTEWRELTAQHALGHSSHPFGPNGCAPSSPRHWIRSWGTTRRLD